MPNPQSFLSNSDFQTLKNDAKGQVAVVIGTGATIPPGATLVFSGLASIGKQNAGIRSRGTTTLYPGNVFPGTTIYSSITLHYPDPGGAYDQAQTLYINLERISAFVVRAYAVVTNYAPYAITVVGGAQTVTFDVNTFLSPFIS